MARIQAITPGELELLILRLTDYAASYLRFKTGWIRRGTLPEGHDAGSIASEAIARVLRGTRRWDPDADPDLLGYLKSVVKSIVWDLMKAAEKEALEPPDDADELAIEEVPSRNPGPDADLIASEVAERMLGALATDDERLVFLSICDGHEKAADIAAELGLDVREVYRIKRTIDRRLSGLKED